MTKLLYLSFLVLAVSAVSIADVFLKKAAQTGGGLAGAFKSPWLLFAIGLYLFQIAYFLFAFVGGWKLSVVSVLQIAFYALITIGAGIFIFGESLSLLQTFGAIFVLIGAVMITI